MTPKMEVLGRELGKVPPPTLTKASEIAGYAHVSTACQMRKNPQVVALVEAERAGRLDTRRDLISKLDKTVGRASRLLDRVKLDHNDPAQVIGALKALLDAQRMALEMQQAYPDHGHTQNDKAAYDGLVVRAVRVGRYLEARSRRRADIDVSPADIASESTSP